ncbi:hypothetical protein C1H46_001642 [Malus baccata]|uniref:Uncharacterized protein n=1 Tax=Malus baccata TaxID=106549 RepID=A0A540NP21_MALBA|nr:hypothetical protein C1H46_001642 [Malus baccata]
MALLGVAVVRGEEVDRGAGEDGDRGTKTVTWATTPDSSLNDSAPLSTLSHSRTPLPIPQSSTQPASKAFSPPLIYAESNGQGFKGGFGGSDDPISPAPSEMLPEEGFTLRD